MGAIERGSLVNHQEHCDALEVEVERFALTMNTVDGAAPVHSCPGWSVLDVAEHLGTIHRWADELVQRRSGDRIPRPALELREGDVSPAWIREGGHRLVATLRAANPDDTMWAWGVDQHVRFWSRRQLHETLVHRMDIELAGDEVPASSIEVAVDAIDEFLANIQTAAKSSSTVSSIRGTGERLGIRDLESGATWMIALSEEGFRVSAGAGTTSAEIAGPSVDLLLVLCRRRAPGERGVTLSGDRQLATYWLERSLFE